MGKLKEDNATLYLIVYGEVMDRILSQDKTIEYRECSKYWNKRIENRDYDFVKITNGYGNATRPYRLYEYTGYEIVNKDDTEHYAIDISEDLIIEKRDKLLIKG